MFLDRLTNYLEDNDLFPYTMIGFRRHLSTQDTMLQLKHHIIDCTGRSTKAILGLDLKKAFDNVTHSTILNQINTLNLGLRTYNYIRAFLTDRTATITVGALTSSEITMGSVGTPQGSVISPMLFNLALLGLPSQLQKIPGLHHTLYADDITLWVCEGSDGFIEQILQEAIHTVERYLQGTGLSCSAEKSELLLYRPTLKGRPPKHHQAQTHADITLTTSDGHIIPTVDKIKVLGLIIESKGTNGETVRNIDAKVSNTMRLIKRITNKHKGMKESSILRLIQSFVLSQITYAAAYHRWFVAEKAKLNSLIRRIHKQALGLPQHASTDLLLKLGLHNTLEELIEAQQISQYERLAKTKSGRQILENLGISYHTQHGDKHDIPRDIRTKLTVPPIPKNMHPEHNEGRRVSRAKAMTKIFGHNEEAVFVDAARYRDRHRFVAAVVDHTHQCKASASIATRHVETAEEVAIALAIAHTNASYIISDSQTAVRNYANGRISPEALRILNTGKTYEADKCVQILWIPAHTPLDQPEFSPNEVAHNVVRGLTFRAGFEEAATRTDTSAVVWEWDDRLTKFCDITQHYRMQRREYPPPHPKLNRAQSVQWRQLQTRTYTNPVIMNHIYPELYTTNLCQYCNTRATLDHILWACPALISNTGVAASNEGLRARWGTALLSSGLDQQLWAIQQAEEAAGRHGLSAGS